MPNDIQEVHPDHHFRTEIPNIIFDLELSTTEFKVYATIKKIAGDRGGCWQSRQHLAEACKISIRTLDDALKRLSEPFELLNNKSLIIIQKRNKPDGSHDTSTIHIMPIWRCNGDYNRAKFKENSGNAETAQGVVQRSDKGSAKVAHKEDPLKKISQEEQQQGNAAAVVFDCLKNLEIPEVDKLWISKHYPEDVICKAVAWATHPLTKLNKSLQQAIKWACTQSDLEIPKPKEKPLSPKEKVMLRFKHYEYYNGALCLIDENGIAFERGMTHYGLSFKEKGFEEQLNNILRKFGIT